MLGKSQNYTPTMYNNKNKIYRIKVTERIRQSKNTEQYHAPNLAQMGQTGKQHIPITTSTSKNRKLFCHFT